MTIKIHDRNLRGKVKGGWLTSWHTFSFGQFHDPKRMGFRSLRVINEDIVIPGAGFPTHPHDNMEIITYIMDGALEHKDSMGTGSVIRPGEVQKMSAGTGITHSEFNPSKEEPVHLLQIWIRPDTRDVKPDYQQISVNGKSENQFGLVADKNGTDDAIKIYQDARLYLAKLQSGKDISYSFDTGRYGFVQIAKGEITLNGEVLKQGDGAEISGVDLIELKALADSEILLFDLA